MQDYWRKQSKDSPLFPDLLWEKPERRDLAGKLLLVGGSSLGFRAPAAAYEVAMEHGIGECHVLVPEVLRQLTKQLPHVFYGEATQTGSFSTKAKDTLFSAAQWADGVLLIGDVGRNSETSVLLAEFLRGYKQPLAVTRDALDALYPESQRILQRENTLLVLALGQLQYLAKESKSPEAFTLDLDFTVFVERLHSFSSRHAAIFVVRHHNQILIAKAGQVISTKRDDLEDIWRTETATRAITSWLHHPGDPLSAVAVSVL